MTEKFKRTTDFQKFAQNYDKMNYTPADIAKHQKFNALMEKNKARPLINWEKVAYGALSLAFIYKAYTLYQRGD